MRTRTGYWLGGGLIVLAVAGAIAWAVLAFASISGTVDDFIRVAAGDGDIVTLQARTYVVYAEGPNADVVAPSLRVEIRDVDSDRALSFDDPASSVTYSFGGHTGSAEATVTPPRAGDYVVSVEQSPGTDGVALGDSIATSLVGGIGGAVAIGAVLGLAGLILIVVTAVRRGTRRPPPPATPPAAA